MAYIVCWEDRGLVLEFSGSWSGDDFLKITLDLYSDSRHNHLEYIIANFSAVDKLDVSDEVVRQYSAIDMAASVANPHTKVAFIAESEEVVAMTNLYRKESAGSTWIIEHFDTMRDARAWALG